MSMPKSNCLATTSSMALFRISSFAARFCSYSSLPTGTYESEKKVEKLDGIMNFLTKYNHKSGENDSNKEFFLKAVLNYFIISFSSYEQPKFPDKIK